MRMGHRSTAPIRGWTSVGRSVSPRALHAHRRATPYEHLVVVAVWIARFARADLGLDPDVRRPSARYALRGAPRDERLVVLSRRIGHVARANLGLDPDVRRAGGLRAKLRAGDERLVVLSLWIAGRARADLGLAWRHRRRGTSG